LAKRSVKNEARQKIVGLNERRKNITDLNQTRIKLIRMT